MKAAHCDGFHWLMAHCTEAVEMYEEHVEGYNPPKPPVTKMEAVVADLNANLTDALMGKRAAESALVAAQKDGERLDWLEANPEAVVAKSINKSWGRKVWWMCGQGDFDTARAAIDAARLAADAKEGKL
jgi:hypothetical protein